MDSFERSFEDMDVRSEYVEQTMNSSTTAAMPEGEVDTLMQALATRAAHVAQGLLRLPARRPPPAARRVYARLRPLAAGARTSSAPRPPAAPPPPPPATTPAEQMVADEHGLKMADTFGAASVAKVAAPSAGTQQEAAGTPMPAGGGPLSGAVAR